MRTSRRWNVNFDNPGVSKSSSWLQLRLAQHRPRIGAGHLRRVSREIAVIDFRRMLPPLRLAMRQFLVADFEVYRASGHVDGNEITRFDQRDRPTRRRLGADVTDARPARRPAEPPVGQ